MGTAQNRILLFLVPFMLFVACRKEDIGTPAPVPLEFTASSSPQTKASYIPSSTLGNLPIYISADYKKDGITTPFLFNRSFSRGADNKYHASPLVYWPMDGIVDFLAYSGTDAALSASGNPSISWDSTPSRGAVFTFSNTKTAEQDLVWAVANRKSKSASPVELDFSHALARLELNVQATNMSGKLCLKSVVLETSPEDRLALQGVFTVDNSKNRPEAVWSGLATLSDYGFFTGQNITFSSSGLTSLVGLLNGTARVAKDGESVPLANMFIPPQANKNLKVTYALAGGADTVETINLTRYDWEMGKRYIYQLVFTGAGLEIDIIPPFGDPEDEETW